MMQLYLLQSESIPITSLELRLLFHQLHREHELPTATDTNTFSRIFSLTFCLVTFERILCFYHIYIYIYVQCPCNVSMWQCHSNLFITNNNNNNNILLYKLDRVVVCGLFGHVARLSHTVPANQILRTCTKVTDGEWPSQGWRHAWPPTTWIHQICHDTGVTGWPVSSGLAGTDPVSLRSWSVQWAWGWPGPRLQTLPSKRPDARPTWQCRALCAGVPWVSRAMWPNTDKRRLLMRSITGGKPVRADISGQSTSLP